MRNRLRIEMFSDRDMKKRTLRNRILEIQETLVYLRLLKRHVRHNYWFDAILKYSYHKEDRLLRKYLRLYGEFPLGMAEEVFQ